MSTDADLVYSIRRSTRARRVRVVVSPGGEVEVVLPARARARAAQAAVVHLRPWIERRLAIAARTRERLAGRDGMLPYLDERLSLVAQPNRAHVTRRGDTLLVPDRDPSAAIERWYRRAARLEIAPRLDEATTALGVTYARLRIAGQRTRWGSCSTTGTMSFNWRLLLAPSEVLDYVVWHEACHLRHLDHSPAFWALLAQHLPDHQRTQAWLRAHGATLALAPGAELAAAAGQAWRRRREMTSAGAVPSRAASS